MSNLEKIIRQAYDDLCMQYAFKRRGIGTQVSNILCLYNSDGVVVCFTDITDETHRLCRMDDTDFTKFVAADSNRLHIVDMYKEVNGNSNYFEQSLSW